MNKTDWYSSKEHFETEMSYEEYCKKLNKERKKLDTPDFGLD